MEFRTCKRCSALTKNTDDSCWKCLRPIDETRELDLRLEAPAAAVGSVKWFSTEKGYGFIRDAHGIDRHFAVRDVVGVPSCRRRGTE